MPAKRCKKNAQLGLVGKIGAEWCWYGKKISLKAPQTNVGAGLPAIAVGQRHRCRLISRYRGQARSHTVLWRTLDQTRIEVPVISFGCSNPISLSMVGATSASTPPSRTFRSRLPT
ncbi:hypothetical protein PFLmoz3_04523 [Pseudomonas fluorescens]|uniref:Uncharacterized protein n=1 Tax=Pseudomonas fluorescens TaxID=294 RepID=A0A109LDN2_PSEFL|nr:hypothetical protein PFLmoz3_04523 [Pseudomonas fluorescens]